MGRPPIGKIAMTGAERVRRHRERKFGNKPRVTKLHDWTVGLLEAHIVELQAELERERVAHLKTLAKLEQATATTKVPLPHLVRHRQERGRPVEFTEVGRLKAEIGRLKADLAKLRAALQEEPDAAKLRKKVIDQQVEMASMRRAMKGIAKERDEYRARVNPKFREASKLLTRKNHDLLIKALHSDRSKHVTAAELAEAARVAIALRPLFIESA
jgi:uncharacterized small protein (DUF1192 family)